MKVNDNRVSEKVDAHQTVIGQWYEYEEVFYMRIPDVLEEGLKKNFVTADGTLALFSFSFSGPKCLEPVSAVLTITGRGEGK